jgi:hypothetical protein
MCSKSSLDADEQQIDLNKDITLEDKKKIANAIMMNGYNSIKHLNMVSRQKGFNNS